MRLEAADGWTGAVQLRVHYDTQQPVAQVLTITKNTANERISSKASGLDSIFARWASRRAVSRNPPKLSRNCHHAALKIVW
jgi:hypothetical protein